MRLFTYILILILISSSVFGQINKRDLQGSWTTISNDSSYYKSDTLEFSNNSNTLADSGSYIKWEIDENNILVTDFYTNGVLGRSIGSNYNLNVTKTDFGQLINLNRKRKLIDKFKVIEHEKTGSGRRLVLMRFDVLSDYKLEKYVDSLMYKVLNYDTTRTDTIFPNIGGNRANVKIKLKDGYDPNPEPLIVINGYIADNKELLRKFRLVETISIVFINKMTAQQVFGYRADNGVIIINVSKRRFKEEWKNYGR
jgi:hypothetical protein